MPVHPSLQEMYDNRFRYPPEQQERIVRAYEDAAAAGGGAVEPAPMPRQPVPGWTPESRTEGAPSGDLGLDNDLGKPKKKARKKLPRDNGPGMGEEYRRETEAMRRGSDAAERELEAYRADAETEASAYRDGFVNPQPGTDAWDAQGRNMDRSDGMSEEQVAHEDWVRSEQARMRRLMGTGQMNPGQPMEQPSLEDKRKWDKWVRSSPDRMERYDPQGFAERQGAEDEKRYDRIAEQYGPGEAAAVRAAAMNGTVYIPQKPAQRSKNDERKRLEREAIGEEVTYGRDANGRMVPTVKEGGARDKLRRSEATTNAFAKQSREGVASAGAKYRAEREADPRWQAWKNQMMLAGGNPAKNAANAIGMLPQDQQNAALQYIAAGGRGATPLDVETANANQALRLLQGANLGTGFGAANPLVQQQQNFQMRKEAAAYADTAWNALPYYERTEERRAQLARDIDNRFPGGGHGVVAAELPVYRAGGGVAGRNWGNAGGSGGAVSPPDTGTVAGGM